jgi:hypothetical protein
MLWLDLECCLPKGLHCKGLIPRLVLLEVVEPLRGGAYQ